MFGLTGGLAGIDTSDDNGIGMRHSLLFLLLVIVSGVARAATIAGCPLFPADNIWNTPIDSAPVDPSSSTYVATIGASTRLHADFGTVYNRAPNGIPYITVAGTQTPVNITFQYSGESDPGPYPIPPDAPIEGGPDGDGDRHVLIVDRDRCLLYEVYDARPQVDGSWRAGSGAKWDLRSNALRPAPWTSADAAGLPILPGLVRYDEVMSGEIDHALRFTVPQTRNAYVWPARHPASSLSGLQYPPMGLRFRLKASFDTARFSPAMQVILRALKKYGMMVADNGSAWYLSGAPDSRWSDDDLRTLAQLTGNDFEVVSVANLQVSANSGQALQSAAPLVDPPADADYDIDGDGRYDALTDGLLVMRYLFGLRGSSLVTNATGTGAARTAAAIETRLAQLGGALDTDGDGRLNALTDGMLITRSLFGITGAGLVAGATAPGASRTTAQAVSAFIERYVPPR